MRKDFRDMALSKVSKKDPLEGFLAKNPQHQDLTKHFTSKF